MNERSHWVRRRCVGCGCRFDYPPGSHSPFTPSRGLLYPLERLLADGWTPLTSTPPCPECGCVQPDAVAKGKRLGHALVGLAVFGVSAVVWLVGQSGGDFGLTYSTAGLISGVVSAVGLVGHAAVAFAHPNRHRERNLRRAVALQSRGKLEAASGPDAGSSDSVPRAVGPGVVPALAVAAVGVLLLFAPPVLKGVNRWPTCDGTRPEVVSPGDRVRVWFTDQVVAVNGKWSGVPRAEIAGIDPAGPVAWPASGNNDIWGDEISGKDVENRRTTPWADITLPDDPALVGRTVEVRADMEVVYPKGRGPWYDNHLAAVAVVRPYTLAERGASDTYRTSYWVALGGVGLVAACGVGLWFSADRLQHPPSRR